MKKSLLLLVAVITGLSAWAQQTVINVVEQTAHITQTSTLYVGEVVLDGQPSFYYLYSEDMTNTSSVLGPVRDCLSDFKDGNFSALVPSIAGESDGKGIAVCSNADYESKMNSDWTSAANAGQECLLNTTVTSSSSENLFETNADFVEKCTRLLSDNGIELVDDEGESLAVSGILGVLSSINSDAVTYTVIDGALVKLVDRSIDYYDELVTVMYTKAELKSNETGVEDINASQPRSGQRYNVMGQPVGKDYKGVVIEDGKKLVIK
ncbi:MAG: hypothetical protein J5565_00750 [Muribaculaceae bacterium]|nr:hypothetical protein [Muribaculaceae bacterium]